MTNTVDFDWHAFGNKAAASRARHSIVANAVAQVGERRAEREAGGAQARAAAAASSSPSVSQGPTASSPGSAGGRPTCSSVRSRHWDGRTASTTRHATGTGERSK